MLNVAVQDPVVVVERCQQSGTCANATDVVSNQVANYERLIFKGNIAPFGNTTATQSTRLVPALPIFPMEVSGHQAPCHV